MKANMSVPQSHARSVDEGIAQPERRAPVWPPQVLEAARAVARLLGAPEVFVAEGRVESIPEIRRRDRGELVRRRANASRIAGWLRGSDRGPTLCNLERLPEDARIAVAQLIEARARDEVAAWLRVWA